MIRQQLALFVLVATSIALTLACGSGSCPADTPPLGDPHSLANPGEIRVDHVILDLDVDFDARQIRGRASLEIENITGGDTLRLDTRGLAIAGVRLDDAEVDAQYRVGEEVEGLGQALIVTVAPQTKVVHVDYATGPDAVAVQWLDPQQTSGGREPFLLTQSQSNYARTWVPCQDSPAARMTYEATVRVPPGLLALMSAENPTEASPDGVYSFRMPQSIPAYLLALAVGELEFRSLGPRSGVYAEPEVVASAADEFAQTEQMIDAAEGLYGDYLWERFDILVLPPSFPFGGMENPRLTFVTPTLLAGDRSLVATVAHELAHSWSGNLVTNAGWDEVWLNESFTSYFEKRIVEEVYGRELAEMQSALDTEKLVRELERLGPDHADSRLKMDLSGRGADDGFTTAAYDKGYLFLRLLEESVGREEWDRFLTDYFQRFAFDSVDTEQFLALARDRLPNGAELAESVDFDQWIYGTGIPDNRPEIRSEALGLVDRQAEAWLGGAPTAELDVDDWNAFQMLRFVRQLSGSLDAARLAELDRALGLTESGNAEILHAWLMLAVANDYAAADPALEAFLIRVGRMKFIDPLYRTLAARPQGKARALEIYAQARPGYHPVAQSGLDEILDYGDSAAD